MSVTVLPPTRGGGVSRGPKLTLQTSTVSIPFTPKPRLALSISTPSTESPTVRNTLANAFYTTSDIPLTGFCQPSAPTVERPPSIVATPSKALSASSSSSGEASPFSGTVPYTLAIGSHSILRNSPIPRIAVSTTSLRQPRRFFPDIKRVKFKEKLVDVTIPSLTLESESPDTDSSISSVERGRRTLRLYDNEAQPIEKSTRTREKRRRELAWPTGSDSDDESLPDPKHVSPPSTSPVTSPTMYLQPLTFEESPRIESCTIKEIPISRHTTEATRRDC